MAPLILHSLLTALLLVLGVESQSRTIQRPCKNEEVGALWEFRDALASTSDARFFDSWKLSVSCCSWKGVECNNLSKDDDDSRRFTQLSSGYRVRALTLPGSSLAGQISPSIAGVKMLDTVDLSDNRISGSIPSHLATLPHLRVLDLSRNNLSGVFPDEFRGGFPEIVSLNLTDNSIEGDIPSMSSSPSLQSVDFSFNFFTGGIPTGFPCARIINVSDNLLTGPVLAPLSRCNASVEILHAGGNLFNFSLAAEADFFRSTAGSGLRVLDLNNNHLQGEIPAELGCMTSLEELSLHYNYLVGEIPAESFNCTRIKLFNLRENHIRGDISTLNFSRLSNLTELDLSYNKLAGDIPASLAGCRNLTSLALAGNKFSGDIPSWFGALKSLNFLTLSGNELRGGFPESLQECDSLVALVISKNKFNTELTSGNFTGFKNLQLLAVGNSGLSGGIPRWIANCSKLQVLDLSWNRFTGEIPEWIGELDHLFYLDLSNNSLTGTVSPRVVNSRCLRHDADLGAEDDLRPVANLLFVKHRSNSSALLYHQVSAFPPSIILSNNHLSGRIPDAFGSLKKLVSLDLSNNWFSGAIPSGLANATDLELLDLSSNRFNGAIPDSLVKLTFLAIFNVSYNNLSGTIPTRNQFASFSNSSYMFNSKLCGPPLVNPCVSIQTIEEKNSSDSPRSMNRGAIMGVTISISLGLTALFATMVVLSFSRKGGNGTFPRTFRAGRFDEEENFKELTVSQMMNLSVTMFSQHYRRMAVLDLIKATDNFNPANIIGCGGFGLVFKANLPDGNIVAIKRLTGDDGGPQMEREFDSELSTLGMITHENLVSLEGYCRLGRDRLLVYSYMENGSLDYWLHEHQDGGSRLTWKNRLEILRETARGLEYLHRGCEPHIIHRDIKSSNILLDGDMRAHVADFGLARLILPSDTHVSTELVGTLGYIPPEYAESSVATLRGDVYSFGVLVLEVLSRRRPVDACRRGGIRGLVPWARGMQECGRGMEVMDPLMLQGEEYAAATANEGAVVDEMLRVLDVACYCVDVCPQRRPGMKEVLEWMEDVGRRKR